MSAEANSDRQESMPAGVAGEVLYGAGEISEFLFGDAAHAGRVYRAVAAQELPVFKLGKMVCARRSTLLTWMERGELGARRAG